MSMAPPALHDFARRLTAFEAARAELPGAPLAGAVRVCDRLRASLTRLAGAEGFRSLMSRALALAKSRAPSLAAVQVRADGALDGLDGLPHTDDAGVIIVAQFLELLATFIGEPLTLRLVRDAWPDAPEAAAAGAGEQA